MCYKQTSRHFSLNVYSTVCLLASLKKWYRFELGAKLELIRRDKQTSVSCLLVSFLLFFLSLSLSFVSPLDLFLRHPTNIHPYFSFSSSAAACVFVKISVDYHTAYDRQTRGGE